ncbi:MAG: hypothetical protein ACI351_04495 [Candidatus Avelusimicrobium sp.]|uniref:hypothetical protein n=1 Tax=Candidatus Avelusimicrobium sp. TaxID=3048833 RepID=UPI003F0977D3
MKNISMLLVALLVIGTAVPLAAQNKTLYNKVQRTVAAQRHSDATSQKNQPDTRRHHSCVYCGEEITEPYQHCSAQDGVGICSEQKQTVENNNPDTQENFCPKCGHEYTVDEKYHGEKHVCKKQQPVCAYCGEEIIESYQHCFAENGVGICSEEKKTTENDPHKVQADCCPACGHEYTVDEKYHGERHVCTKQKPVCAYCGEEIIESYQHCSAQDGVGICSEQKQTVENNNPDTQENFCSKCGHKYTVDEKYHGTKHICSKSHPQK